MCLIETCVIPHFLHSSTEDYRWRREEWDWTEEERRGKAMLARKRERMEKLPGHRSKSTCFVVDWLQVPQISCLCPALVVLYVYNLWMPTWAVLCSLKHVLGCVWRCTTDAMFTAVSFVSMAHHNKKPAGIFSWCIVTSSFKPYYFQFSRSGKIHGW